MIQAVSGASLTSIWDERLGSHEHTQRAPVVGLHYKLLLVNVIAPGPAIGLQNVTAKATACTGSQPPRRVLLGMKKTLNPKPWHP